MWWGQKIKGREPNKSKEDVKWSAVICVMSADGGARSCSELRTQIQADKEDKHYMHDNKNKLTH
jgi:hypothetical protein